MSAGAPAMGMADPAAMAAMQAQAYQAQMYQAQMYQAAAAQQAMYGQGMYPPGMQPAAYTQGPGSVLVQPQTPGPFPGGPAADVNGAYGYMPSDGGGAYGQAGPLGPNGYAPEGYGGGAYDQSGYAGGPQGGGYPYGGQGCDNCNGAWGIPGSDVNGQMLPNGLLGDVLGLIAPYPDGGCAAPRWYDFAVDYMMLKRDNTGRSQPFTSLGPQGPIVLETNDLNFGQFRPGFRFSAAVQLMAANSLEFTYFGQFNFTSQAAVTNANGQLFSVFSGFGATQFFGSTEFDNANFQQISYVSQFDSFEINWRRRWMSPNCRYQGSWTLGVRHFILDEQFAYASANVANGFQPPFPIGAFIPARGLVQTFTTNDLTGFQIGTDAWICVLPGFRVGGEFQAGVYGNHMNINTVSSSNLTLGTVDRERLQSNDVSFIGQANLLATYRFNYQWSGRIGYQFLYVDGVALASENFNPVPLNQQGPPRAPVVNDNGNVFYHGWSVGLEYMW